MALKRVSEMKAGLRRRREAAIALASARALLSQIPDRDQREEASLALSLTEALSPESVGDPEKLRDLSMAFEKRGERLRRGKARLALAVRLGHLGQTVVAEDVLRDLLQTDSRTVTTHDEADWAEESEVASSSAEELVRLFLNEGRAVDALVAIEQARGEPALRRPEPGTAVVALLQMEGEIVAWLIPPTGEISVERTPLSRSATRGYLARRDAFRSLGLEAPPVPEILPPSLCRTLASFRRVIIVPDSETWPLDLEQSRCNAASKTLFEVADVAYASSVRRAVESAHRVFAMPRRIVAVGDPSWDPQEFSGFARLPASEREARGVADQYQHSVLLIGPKATRQNLLRAAEGADALHIATHAVSNDRVPRNSFLLLAREPTGGGAWTASSPDWRRLAGARLIVLSACRSAPTSSRRSLSVGGLISQLQRGRVERLVIATSDIDDSEAVTFADRFHAQIRQGVDPISALGRASPDRRRVPPFRVVI